MWEWERNQLFKVQERKKQEGERWPYNLSFFWFFWMCLQVVRCCLEHAASVAKTFLTCDVVVVDIKEPEAMPTGGNQMDNSGRWQLWGEKKKGSLL